MTKEITLAEPGTCGNCGETIPKGGRARYYSRDKMYHAPDCRNQDKDPVDQVEADERWSSMTPMRQYIHGMRKVLELAERQLDYDERAR